MAGLPIPRRSVLWISGLAGLFGCIAVVVTDIAGILVHQPGYSPLSQSISHLAAGPQGWIQDDGLYAGACGAFLCAVGLFVDSIGGWIWTAGCVCLFCIGADLVVIADVNQYLGATNPGPDVHHGSVYALALLIFAVSLLFAPGLGRLRPSWKRWSVSFAVCWIIVAPLYGLVPEGWDGAYERFLVVLALLWLIAISSLLIARARQIPWS